MGAVTVVEPPLPPPTEETDEGECPLEPEEDKEHKKISPYPEGFTKPQFKHGPEDYAFYTLFDPRDMANKMVIESPLDSDSDPGIDAEELAEIERQKKQKAYDAVTFDDWGEDFSFLS